MGVAFFWSGVLTLLGGILVYTAPKRRLFDDPPILPLIGACLFLLGLLGVFVFGIAYGNQAHQNFVQDCLNHGGIPVSSYGHPDICGHPTPSP